MALFKSFLLAPIGLLWYIGGMFIEKKTEHELRPEGGLPSYSAKDPWYGKRKKILIFGIAILALMLMAGFWLMALMKNDSEDLLPSDAEEQGVLPGTLEPSEDSQNNNGQGNSDIKAESILFGDYYEPFDEPLELNLNPVELPLNVKTDVANYHEVARRINLDPVIDNLNRDGFAVLDNQLPGDDFFALYRELGSRSLPYLITSDFLVYYHQNVLKNTYKQVEAFFFYETLWSFNKTLFDQANARYLARLNQVGQVNDPLLEAARLEAAYFATALSVLSPKEGQINPNEDLNDNRTFRPSEVRRFTFEIPAYLEGDVRQELSLIASASSSEKSPVLLYQRNYRDFIVPPQYSSNAKLRNAYLAIRWQASLFPMFYQDEDCSECLLDRDDWVINQTAAYLLSADIASDQFLKNEWAKIYKVVAWFGGLRSDLTYLHYEEARHKLFPEEAPEDIFAEDVFSKLLSLREELKAKQFGRAEGSLSRSGVDQLGMRLLQSAYWPSEYLFSRLTFAEVGEHLTTDPSKANFLTVCRLAKSLFRCRGIGYDLLALVAEKDLESAWLKDNMSYRLYSQRQNELKNELSLFNKYSWYGNNFWTTLSLAGSLVNGEELFPYQKNIRWHERLASSALASLSNLASSADLWQVDREAVGGLEIVGGQDDWLYVETNLDFIEELAATTKMVHRALVDLGVVRENDPELSELYNQLMTVRRVARAQMSGEEPEVGDLQALADLVSKYKVTESRSGLVKQEFINPSDSSVHVVNQNIKPLRLLLSLHKRDDRIILNVGPIFSYREIVP